MLVAGVMAVALLMPTVAAAADSTAAQTSDSTQASMASAATVAAPEPTPALVGTAARSIAVLGDSISAGTGSDGGPGTDLTPPGEERPRRSWATGDWETLDSVHQRAEAALDADVGAHNLSSNGRRSQHILEQVQGSPEDIGYILVQIGGNDLCRETVEDMTSPEDYRDNIARAVAWVAEHRPDAMIQLNSVPDVYRLWEMRRTNPVAVALWGLGIIPCQSLLARPTSQDDEDMQRRAQVRERTLAYNVALREVCATYLRCRYDDDATYDFSNDVGRFVDADISNQDHFHPSFTGQQKLAEVSWGAGVDVSDRTPPELAVRQRSAGDGVVAAVTATDGDAVAGIEVRRHGADGQVGDWEVTFDDEVEAVLDPGATSFVEVRATDVNGNRSASVVEPVTTDHGVTCQVPRFSDVPADYVHTPAILGIAEACITLGYPDGTYRPNGHVTRGQMATFIANALGRGPGDLSFSDVTADHPHAVGISAMRGVASGYPDGTFRPNQPVTRGQMATFLTNAAELPAGTRGFPDVPAEHTHAAAISSVAGAGIAGFTDGTFRPGNPVTRGQMATFLHVTLVARGG